MSTKCIIKYTAWGFEPIVSGLPVVFMLNIVNWLVSLSRQLDGGTGETLAETDWDQVQLQVRERENILLVQLSSFYLVRNSAIASLVLERTLVQMINHVIQLQVEFIEQRIGADRLLISLNDTCTSTR